MNETDLLRIADGRTARLGVHNDLYRHVKVGVLVNIHMADARAGFDAGNGCIFNAGADQPRAAARDQKIDKAVRRHQRLRARMRRVLDDVDDIAVAADGFDARLERCDDGVGRTVRLLAAAQHAHIAALDAQRCCV